LACKLLFSALPLLMHFDVHCAAVLKNSSFRLKNI